VARVTLAWATGIRATVWAALRDGAHTVIAGQQRQQGREEKAAKRRNNILHNTAFYRQKNSHLPAYLLPCVSRSYYLCLSAYLGGRASQKKTRTLWAA